MLSTRQISIWPRGEYPLEPSRTHGECAMGHSYGLVHVHISRHSSGSLGDLRRSRASNFLGPRTHESCPSRALLRFGGHRPSASRQPWALPQASSKRRAAGHGATQMPFMHEPLVQSSLPTHAWPLAQRFIQANPQSISVSCPFFTPSAKQHPAPGTTGTSSTTPLQSSSSPLHVSGAGKISSMHGIKWQKWQTEYPILQLPTPTRVSSPE